MNVVVVGNDVVDLDEPRTHGRASDERFVRRVFDDAERATISEAEDPDLELWAHWAGKEAGFKIISKLIGAPPPFAHRAFKVRWTDGVGVTTSPPTRAWFREGWVTYEEHAARISVAHCPGSMHAIGFGVSSDHGLAPVLRPHLALLDSPLSLWAGSLETLRSRFTPRELDAVYSRHSAAVRLGARSALAAALGVHEERLEIVCDPGPTSQRPPRVLLDGRRGKIDVSLSHDGRWIAWLLWIDHELEDG